MTGRWVRGCLTLVASVMGLWLLPAWAQKQEVSGDDPSALLAQTTQLYHAGKFADAIPIAQRYVEVIAARHSLDGPEYATALNNLGELLRSANRLGEAEPIMRRALAIN